MPVVEYRESVHSSASIHHPQLIPYKSRLPRVSANCGSADSPLRCRYPSLSSSSPQQPRALGHALSSRLIASGVTKADAATTLASSARDPLASQPGVAATVHNQTTPTPASQRSSRASFSSSTDKGRSTGGSSGGKGPEDDPDADSAEGDSLQIGLDPFSQQLLVAILAAGGAWGIATFANLDLSHMLRPEADALTIALQLSAPVLVLLLAVVAPRWAPPYKGSELERLRHNYYMTAQVLQIYLGDEDEEGDEEASGDQSDGEGGGSAWADGPGSGGERARVRRRLRLEQTVGWGTISSGLALMQAFTLQPWNQPTANSVFGLGLAGRSMQQLANEFLVRGVVWGLLSGWVAGELSSADTSDGILFYGKVFGGPDAVKYVAGLGLVALALPGALWEARSARNFVRASVVGPVRDAAIFCTGNGVDEPAYCDPAGFALMAARRPANAAPVADVVTKTRGWRSGPEATYSSGVNSLGSVDLDEVEEAKPDQAIATTAATTTTAPGASLSALKPASTSSASSSASSSFTPSESPNGSNGAPTSQSASPAQEPPASSSPSSASTSGQVANDRSTSSSAPSTSSSSAAPAAPLPPLGATLKTSSAAFEWDTADMSVLLRVETLQDKIAFSSSLYYQLLAAFAINGAFLASDCNLLASFSAAWLLRTGPLLLAELRARATADAALRG